VAAVSELVASLKELMPLWRRDPVAFVKDTIPRDPEGRLTVIDEPQKRILRAIAEHDRVVVRACHGPGKTAVGAWCALWFVSTRMPALVVTMAGTWNHLEDKFWPELRLWGRGWKMRDAFDWKVLSVQGATVPGEAPEMFRIKAAATDRAENIEG